MSYKIKLYLPVKVNFCWFHYSNVMWLSKIRLCCQDALCGIFKANNYNETVKFI